MSAETFHLIEAFGIVGGMLGVILGFLIALWKTGLWFGQLTAETKAVHLELSKFSENMAEGFRRNDEAHAVLHARIDQLAIRQ